MIHSFAGGKITDTGPLTKKRMETIDDEVNEKTFAFMEKSKAAGSATAPTRCTSTATTSGPRSAARPPGRVASAVAVDEDGTTGPPDLGERERPTFFRLDAGRKELTLLGPDSRRGEVTKLDSVMEKDGAHIFSGVENGRVISVIITDSGRMTLSIINDGVVWSVFGHALPEGQLRDHPTEKRVAADGE